MVRPPGVSAERPLTLPDRCSRRFRTLIAKPPLLSIDKPLTKLDSCGSFEYREGGGIMRAIGNKTTLAFGLAGFFLLGNTALAGDAGLVKTVKGGVRIERDGEVSVPKPGSPVMVSDLVVTSADGSVGITLQDGTLLSAGPNSTLTLKKGTLSVISGKISKTSQDAVT